MHISCKMNIKNFEIDIPYITVKSINIVPGNDWMSITVGYCKDSQSEAIYQDIFSCSYSVSGDTPVAQAYNYLMTLELFSEAILHD